MKWMIWSMVDWNIYVIEEIIGILVGKELGL